MKLKSKINLSILVLILLSSCTFYTFVDGSSKYNESKKIRIKQFENGSGNGPSDIAAIFTEKTKDYYVQNGKFELVDINEDLILEAEISQYQVGIAGATASETAQQQKLTITVKIEFTDYQIPENNTFKSYTRLEIFDQTQSLSDIESELIDGIADQISTDIFNGTVMTNDW